MAVKGPIRDKMEIKWLILYITSRLIEPVPLSTLQELIVYDEGVDYFDFSECLDMLVESGHIDLSDDGMYTITPKGQRNGQAFEPDLPYSVRLHADRDLHAFNQKLRRAAQVRAEVSPRENGTYTVTLSLSDEGNDSIIQLALMVPKADMAEDLAARFREDAEKMYGELIRVLFDPPKKEAATDAPEEV